MIYIKGYNWATAYAWWQMLMVMIIVCCRCTSLVYIYIYIYRVAQKKVPNIRMALCNRVVEMNQQKARM